MTQIFISQCHQIFESLSLEVSNQFVNDNSVHESDLNHSDMYNLRNTDMNNLRMQ